MTSSEYTRTQQAPSARRLLRSTAIAAAVSAAILVTIVLPAEYGVDPTGVGRILGLTAMGETKMALEREDAALAAAQRTADSAAASGAAAAISDSTGVMAAGVTEKTDSITLVLAPNQGEEIKLTMRKDARVTFSWSTNRGVVNYDTHGDSPTLSYHGYGKGTGVGADQGELIAAFDGKHGWFWRNRGTDTVTVTLRTKGDYQELIRM